VENNYNPNIPKWANVNYPITSMYDDAHVNVIEALPFQTNHKSKEIKREKKNPKCKSYNFMDSTKLAQILYKISGFYRIKKYVITECPHINSDLRDGFVRQVGQQMLDKGSIEQP
jgi:phospholipase C